MRPKYPAKPHLSRGKKNLDWLNPQRLFLRELQWPFVIILGFISIVLGTIGFWRYYQTYSWLDCFYQALQLFPMNSGALPPPIPWELEVARLMAPLVTAFTFILALMGIFRNQAHLIRLSMAHNHVVICGLGQKGVVLAHEFRQKNVVTVIIESNDDNPRIETCREWGAIILIGDAREAAMLRKARVQYARVLIAVCDDDGVNAKISMQAKEICEDLPNKQLNCLIHIVDPQLCNLLREQESSNNVDSGFRLEFFNIFERGALLMLQEYPAFNSSNPQKDHVPHILVIGLGRFGESLIIHAAKTWRDWSKFPDKRLRITFIDRDADWKYESLLVRYPLLLKYCDLQPIKLDLRSPDFHRGRFLFNQQGQCDVDTIYILMDNDAFNLQTGLTLLRQVKDQPTQLVIRMVEASGLAALLELNTNTNSAFRHLHSFALLDRTCTDEILLNEILARFLHEEYVRTQIKKGDNLQENPSLAPWDELHAIIVEANRHQAEHIEIELKAIHCRISTLTVWEASPLIFSAEEIEKLAHLEHDLWCQDKRNAGWTHTPSKRSPTYRVHPALVDWNELPELEKEKNREMVLSIPGLLMRAGYQIERLKSDKSN